MGMAEIKKSYQETVNTSGFWKDFYITMFDINPDLKKYFASTDWDKQYKSMQKALGLVIMLAKRSKVAKKSFDELSKLHGKNQLNVNPAFYGDWVVAFISTLKAKDPQLSPILEIEWKAIIMKSIDFLTSHYDESGGDSTF